jgi:hypothetical protein
MTASSVASFRPSISMPIFTSLSSLLVTQENISVMAKKNELF